MEKSKFIIDQYYFDEKTHLSIFLFNWKLNNSNIFVFDL